MEKSNGNKIDTLSVVLSIVLIFVALFVAPNTPTRIYNIINTIYFRILFILVLILLSYENIGISLLLVIIYMIIINNKSNYDIETYDTNDANDESCCDEELQMCGPEDMHMQTLSNIPDEIPAPNIASIPISSASETALLTDARTNIINNSTIPITSDLTTETAETITAVNTHVDEIVNNIKTNPQNYITNSTQDEIVLKDQLNKVQNPEVAQVISNDINKIIVSKDAVISMDNNVNPETNELLLKHLIKCDLLNNASKYALAQGDKDTAMQLQQISCSNANVANALVQNNILAKTAIQAEQNGAQHESIKLNEIASKHLDATLNIVNYNHSMESALDAFTKGDYNASKEYQNKANDFLKNNISLNDSINGLSVEHSEILYAQVQPYPNAPLPPVSRCDTIKAVNATGWDDYDTVATNNASV